MSEIVNLRDYALDRAKRRHPSYTPDEVVQAVLGVVDDALTEEDEEEE